MHAARVAFGRSVGFKHCRFAAELYIVPVSLEFTRVASPRRLEASWFSVITSSSKMAGLLRKCHGDKLLLEMALLVYFMARHLRRKVIFT
jgi:hypothetical protein